MDSSGLDSFTPVYTEIVNISSKLLMDMVRFNTQNDISYEYVLSIYFSARYGRDAPASAIPKITKIEG